MLKKSLLLFASLLTLTSCIAVENFGRYWEEASVDRLLTGRWKKVQTSGLQDPGMFGPIGTVLSIVEKNGAHEMSTSAVGPQGQVPRPLYPLKTIIAGNYKFIAAGPEKGYLIRYKLDRNELRLCLGDGVIDFVRRNYSRAANIGKNTGEGDYAQIKVMDRETLEILEKVPDSEKYWFCESRFERVQ